MHLSKWKQLRLSIFVYWQSETNTPNFVIETIFEINRLAWFKAYWLQMVYTQWNPGNQTNENLVLRHFFDHSDIWVLIPIPTKSILKWFSLSKLSQELHIAMKLCR